MPNFNPNYYWKYHQATRHDTDYCTRLEHEIQNLIDAGKITYPETRKPNAQNNPLPNYQNVPPLNPRILMINIGLTKEQVFDSFVDTTPTFPKLMPKDLNLNDQPMELKVNILDIWSSDEEDKGQIDL